MSIGQSNKASPIKETFINRSLKFNEAMVELSKHSDTEMALVGCPVLEQISIDIVKSYTVPLTDKEYKLLFAGSGPLATFYSRVLLIYSFGLISKEVRADLDEIASIRNKFAHHFDISSFKEARIAKKCDNLQTITQEAYMAATKACSPWFVSSDLKAPHYVNGKEVGAVLTDKYGNIGVWIDPFLENLDEPRSKFINCLKSMFMILGGIMWHRYCRIPSD